MKIKDKASLKKTIKFLKEFMNLNRKQQLEIIAKFEKELKK